MPIHVVWINFKNVRICYYVTHHLIKFLFKYIYSGWVWPRNFYYSVFVVFLSSSRQIMNQRVP